MAKLVGSYKFVVATVDVGKNKNKKDMLKLGLTFTDEYVNGQFVEMNPQPTVPFYSSLGTVVSKNGKSPAQMTVEILRNALDFTGGFNELHTLMFAQGIAVCEDHDDGNFTRIKYLNNVNDKKNTAGVMTEFSSDVVAELEKIFNAIT